MKPVTEFALLTIITLGVLSVIGFTGLLLVEYLDRPTEFRGAWTVVKQKDRENYGYVTELGWGFVVAGFTNKASAEQAMQEARRHYRHRFEPVRGDRVWEPQ